MNLKEKIEMINDFIGQETERRVRELDNPLKEEYERFEVEKTEALAALGRLRREHQRVR